MLMKKAYTNVESLNYDLMNEIGLSIRDDILYEQDNITPTPIMYNSKSIKCSINPMKPVYPSEFSVVFDPVNNMDLMNKFLSYYFKKEKMNGNFDVLAYSFQEKKGEFTREGRLPNKYATRVKITDGFESSNHEGRYYYNKALSIAYIILYFGGIDADLSTLDIPKEMN